MRRTPLTTTPRRQPISITAVDTSSCFIGPGNVIDRSCVSVVCPYVRTTTFEVYKEVFWFCLGIRVQRDTLCDIFQDMLIRKSHERKMFGQVVGVSVFLVS